MTDACLGYVMTQHTTSNQQLARLGASQSTADKLIDIGLEPWLLLPLDCPWADQFLPEDPIFIDADDIDAAIAENYPSFNPSVFERLSRSSWPPHLWLGHDLMFFPGPLNRICDLAEAGIHPSIASYLSWESEAGVEIVGLIDAAMPSSVAIEPVKVGLGDVEFTIAIDGVEMNAATQAERVLTVLSGPRNLAIELLDVWTAATRASWPTPFPISGLSRFDDLITSSNEPAELNSFERLVAIWNHTMLERLREVAPTIPDWDTAFADEHPDWASRR
jgi:hypothetical protein